ncbi:hypothetical protein ATV_gp21 [Bicaudavirus pozzuoliense]|uniref:Uncharacterized protein ORF240 n=2 Tax=Acidianus two-tailed virus TaxID=315953 RepID=Y240_ATV|nr:hypothetical protein ATV_gp21 [Acidianus two-tailed virus]Q3V4S5.1 RecName: Full=Uncharacterized protein ORF240 [Acidianus two-tailed virus]AON96499.1 hypothetical protein [Acidianus two-tailed phage variant 1]CAI59889.1 hypothetical protein [Acidianus two-tailed virus]
MGEGKGENKWGAAQMSNNPIRNKDFKVFGLVEKIYEQKGEFVKLFAEIKKKLYSMSIEQLLLMPSYARSKLKDEYGHIEFEYAGYGDRIVIVKLEDPWTDDTNKRQGKTAFLVYFSYQTSKPLVPAQITYKIRSIFKTMKELNQKGYRVFPALFANSITPGALKILQNPKINIRFFSDVNDLLNWIYSKVLNRLKKIVEIAKFTLKFDKIFTFLKTIIAGLGYEVPSDILMAWASKPVRP